MKIKKSLITVATALVALFCLTACAGDSIPFEPIRNYYFRNNVNRPDDPKINTSDELLTYFGMGPVMGEDGRPTFVNFQENFVIAVVPDRTDVETELIPVSLTREGDVLTFTYKEKTGGKLSYIMQPLLLVSVDRAYEAPTVIVKKK